MKLNPIKMGNALGGATAILFAICAVFAYAAPAALLYLARSFVHTLDLTPLVPATPPSFDVAGFVVGWAALSAYFWLFGWLVGTLYNAGASNRRAA